MLLFIGIWRTYQRHCSSCWWITQRKLSWIWQSSVQVWLYFFLHLVCYFHILLFRRQFTLKKIMELTFSITFHEMSPKWCFVLFILQERLDLAAMGTTSWVAEAPSFSTWEKHEVAENIPGDDQCHRLDGWN